MVLLQSVIAYVFMERHWELVTRRLSSAVTSDIAALIDVYESYPQDRDATTLTRIASERLGLDVDILRDTDLPPPGPKPFFSILDEASRDELRRKINRPYWTDTVGRSSYIEIRVKLDDGVMRVLARRSQAYASNSHIFLVWMGASSIVLLGVAILFLRNQIRPILRLAEAAESFGKGREIEFRPRGAREVRQAGHAFLEMKRRIERAMEQRTTMLNGVSHDLRTILTRFKLSLALLKQTPEVEDMKRDVDEMSRMLEGYLAFARGDAGEPAVATDLRTLLEELQVDAERQGHVTDLDIVGDPDDHGAPGRVPAPPLQPRLQRGPPRRPHRDPRQPRDALARRPCRRRRPRHAAPPARGGVQAVRAPRRGAQPGRGRLRPRPRDRPRHRALAWRRHHARRQPLGGLRATVRLPA